MGKSVAIVILILATFKVNAHSFEGEYKCRVSDWSPFKSVVTIKNFEKIYDRNGHVEDYTAEVYLDGDKLEGDGYRFLIKKTKKVIRQKKSSKN